MSIQKSYALLRGSVINSLPYQKGGDHYNIEVQTASDIYRIAVDVYSRVAGTKVRYSHEGETTLSEDRLVLYYKDENYNHPILQTMLQTQQGMTPRTQLPSSLHLDYLKSSPALFPINSMTVVPPKDANENGPDLNDDIDPWVQKALKNKNAEIFAFGSSWNDATDPHPDPTQYFHPNPSQGIHDIHMNQGEPGKQKYSNGPGQDGALFFHFTDGSGGSDTWVAMFFRFQIQSIHTDKNGNPA